MTFFEIILLLIIFFLLVFLFLYLLFQKQKSNNFASKEKIKYQELVNNKLDNIGKELTNMQNIKNDINSINYKHNDHKEQTQLLKNKLEELKNQLSLSQNKSKEMSDEIKSFSQIFLSGYQRGKIGEFSLEFILGNLLGNNKDMVYKQYTMKNNTRPDFFLKFPNCNIPIDSKFPYDNFIKITQENVNSSLYQKLLRDLKNNIENHVRDVAHKYISLADNTQEVIMYLPSQALFEFIYSGEKTFEKILLLANDKKVVIAGPNTLPVVIKIIISFVAKEERKTRIEKILKDLAFFEKEFNRFTERWHKFAKRMEGLQKDSKDLSITQGKIQDKFTEIIDSKKTNLLESE